VDFVSKIVNTYTSFVPWKVEDIQETILQNFGFEVSLKDLQKFRKSSDMVDYLVAILIERFDSKFKNIDKIELAKLFKRIYLDTIDKNWIRHIDDMHYLREKV
jgi:preprotein translocase subunit SecA